MAQLINEAKRFQKLAGILNEGKYPSISQGTNLKTHGRIDIPVMLKDEEIDKFVEKLKSPNNPNPEVYVDRDGRESWADGQYYEYTAIVDKLPPNAGGKSGEEMKKIADSLGWKGVSGSAMKESLNEEKITDFNEWLEQISNNWPKVKEDIIALGVDTNTVTPEEFANAIRQKGNDDPNYISIKFGETLGVDRKSDFISAGRGLETFGHFSDTSGGRITPAKYDFGADIYPQFSKKDESIEKTVNEALKKFRKNGK